MKLEEPSREDCLDLIDQTKMNLDALIKIILANGDDISRQDMATYADYYSRCNETLVPQKYL